MPKEKSVGAIVFNQKGKQRLFLLLHYGASHWDFPKGHIEQGEAERDAMMRELREETAIAPFNAKIVPGFSEKIHYFYRSKRGTVFKEVIFFLVNSSNTNVKISFEHKGFKWLPIREAIKKATFKTAKQLLRKADDFLKQRSLGEFK